MKFKINEEMYTDGGSTLCFITFSFKRIYSNSESWKYLNASM